MSYNWVQANDYKQIKKGQLNKIQWNIGNIVIMVIKHLEINQIVALAKP